VGLVNLSLPVSDLHIERKLRRDRNWVLAQVAYFVRKAVDLGLEVSVGGEDASRADQSFVLQVVEAVQAAGARRFRYADTLGVLDPFATYERISRLDAELSPDRGWDGDLELLTHFDPCHERLLLRFA
jgi:homocitrate synthase NifV